MSEKSAVKKRKRKTHPLFVLIMGTALALAGSWSYQLLYIDKEMEEKKTQLMNYRTELIAENNALRQEIEKLNTLSYIEQLAREKLGLVRKGEILIAPKESEN